jgi:hypothetical protein
MRLRACPQCQEAWPHSKFFTATRPDAPRMPICGYCLGVFKRRPRRHRTSINAIIASRSLAADRGWRRSG